MDQVSVWLQHLLGPHYFQQLALLKPHVFVAHVFVQFQVDEMAPQRWKDVLGWQGSGSTFNSTFGCNLYQEIAFEQEISGFYSRYAHQSWKNIISIGASALNKHRLCNHRTRQQRDMSSCCNLGDSIFERDAVRRVVINRPTANRKPEAQS